eukprot:9494884-Pyramimonas_sp.AAC.1
MMCASSFRRLASTIRCAMSVLLPYVVGCADDSTQPPASLLTRAPVLAQVALSRLWPFMQMGMYWR